MPTVTVETWIAASPQRCFDAARDIGLHVEHMARTGERAVAGVTSGLIGVAESVTWEARYSGVPWRMTVRITEFMTPYRFVDEMTAGPFRSFRHVHEFVDRSAGTLMRDTVVFELPLGILGRLAAALVVRGHLSRLLMRRGQAIKEHLESTLP